MEKKLTCLTALCALLLPLTMQAQMNNVVEVENTYAPVLRDADKLPLLPPVKPAENQHYPVEYDTALRPASQFVFTPMQPSSSDAADVGSPRRFVRLAGGMAGQLDLGAAYGHRFSPDDLLDVSFSLHGYSAKVNDAWNTDDKVKTRFYSTRGAACYQHNFAPLTALKVWGDAESQVMDGQHNTLFSLGAQLTPWQLGDWSMGGRAGFEFFGQKYPTNAFLSTRKNRESHVVTALEAAYRLSDEQRVGLDLQADFYTYSFTALHAAHTFDLHPHYTYSTDELQLTLGARLDFFTGVEKKFRVAPDVTLRYHADDDLTLFGQASGGTVANDYRHYASLTPYWIYAPFFIGKNDMPQLSHQFEYIRSAAGVEWNAATGLFARLYGGFNKSTGRAEVMAGNSLVQANGWQWYGHLDLRYDLADTFRWKFDGQYNVWHSDYGSGSDAHAEAIAWRPVLDLATEACYRPLKELSLTADYRLQTFSLHASLPYHRPVTSNLGATVSYDIPLAASWRGTVLTAFVRADNLLARDFDLYPCVRTPGATVMGGFNFTF